MTTNTTTTTDLKSQPDLSPSHGGPDQHGPAHRTGGPKKRGFVWVLLLLIVAGVAGYAVWRAGQPGLVPTPQGGGGRGGRGRGRGGALGPTPVVVAKAHRANVPVYLNGLGNAAAFYTVTVKSRVDGQLMAVHFKEGDLVRQGQLLAEIDPRPFEVQLALAEGQMARDQALLANARLDLQRYQTLLAQDAIPKQQLDTQNASVAQLTGAIRQDQAQIDNAKLQLTYAKVVAPISGRVGLRIVDPGNIVRAADANGLLVITQLQPITVFFTIPEDRLPEVLTKLRRGVRLPVDAYNKDNSTKLESGYLVTADNQIDTSTGTSRLKAVFDNKSGALYPNQFVNVRLLVDTLRDQIVVPNVAVQRGQQGTFVYAVGDDSKVKITPVQTGVVEAENTVILAGLDDGSQVVVDGADRLQNGSTVRIRVPGQEGGGGRGRGGRGGRGRGARSGGGAGEPQAGGGAAQDGAGSAPGGAAGAAFREGGGESSGGGAREGRRGGRGRGEGRRGGGAPPQ